MLALMREGSVQTRYSPVGPVIVPSSVRPCGSLIVGQPFAGVTVDGGGVGVGVGAGVAGGLLIVMLPPVPGETISSAPHADRAMAEQPRTSERWILVTGTVPSKTG